MKSLLIALIMVSAVLFGSTGTVKAETLQGKIGMSPKWGSGWIDLARVTDFRQGDRIKLTIGGSAEKIGVRLLPRGASPDTPTGLEACPVDVPADGLVTIVLKQDHQNIVQMSVHGGPNPWGICPLGEENGPATLKNEPYREEDAPSAGRPAERVRGEPPAQQVHQVRECTEILRKLLELRQKKSAVRLSDLYMEVGDHSKSCESRHPLGAALRVRTFCYRCTSREEGSTYQRFISKHYNVNFPDHDPYIEWGGSQGCPCEWVPLFSVMAQAAWSSS